MLLIRIDIVLLIYNLIIFHVNYVHVVLVIINIAIKHDEIIISSVKLQIHYFDAEMRFTIGMLVPRFYRENIDEIAIHVGKDSIDLSC